MKRVLFYGTIGGLLLALLKVIEYQYFIHTYPGEIYGGLLAIIFIGVGIYVGMRVTHRKALPEAPRPFAVDEAKLKELNLTPREFEILQRIAEGLSNREIAERLFVSENTVKTHSSRVFEKLGVNRRVQAVQKARELRLLP